VSVGVGAVVRLEGWKGTKYKVTMVGVQCSHNVQLLDREWLNVLNPWCSSNVVPKVNKAPEKFCILKEVSKSSL
jgi:hypothetical protein